jgi:hypothetical protein
VALGSGRAVVADSGMPKDAGTELARLRVKIGAHEFEAEGPRQVVAAYFEAWKQLVAVHAPSAGPAAPSLPRADAVGGAPAAGDLAGRDLFAVDRQRNLITLRVSPAGDADAALLLLYGFRLCGVDDGQELLATRLQAALAASGHRRARLDRTLARHRAARLVKRTGRRKGSTYELTQAGYQRAETLARALQATLPSGAVRPEAAAPARSLAS